MDRANWVGDGVEPGLPTFDIQVRRKRSRWIWQVCAQDGRPIMHGLEAARAKASYKANRALFLLLSAATPKSSIRKRTNAGDTSAR